VRNIVIGGVLGLCAVLLAVNVIALVVTTSPTIRNDARLGAVVIVFAFGASLAIGAVAWLRLRRK
jgi:hypothetical protein